MRAAVGLSVILIGCYDGRTGGSDAAVEVDARERGIVRVKVTGFVEKRGLAVYFQDSDSSISLATQTNANGEATGRLGPDGFVTLVAGFEPTLSMWTYTGVQPGDELEFFEPEAVDVETPVDSISIFADGAGAPPFTLRSSCGGAQTVFDPLPVAMPLALCSPRVDLLLEQGQVYRFAKDVDLAQRRVDFEGEFVEYASSLVTMTDAPAATGFVMQSLMGQGFPLERTDNVASVVDGELSVVLGLPLPAGGTMLTQIDFDDSLAQHVVDWRSATPQIALDYDAIEVARATQAPRYDASTTSIVWSEGVGTPGDLVRATLHWLDGQHSRTRSWVLIGPRGEAPVLRVPRLPVPDLVPQVEAPQTMESFVVGDQLAWLRHHMHGRWLAQGVTWPTHGDAGHVVWRSL